MKCILSIYEELLEIIEDHFDSTVEKAAVLTAKTLSSIDYIELRVDSILPVPNKALLIQKNNSLHIDPRFLKHSIKYCKDHNRSYILAHSHPTEYEAGFSKLDYDAEEKILTIAYNYMPNNYHGNAVFTKQYFALRLFNKKYDDLVPIYKLHILTNKNNIKYTCDMVNGQIKYR